jgi:hypothetical protein
MRALRPFLAILLLVAAPASAGQRAIYTQPDGQQLLIDVAGNGDARIGEAGKSEYGLLLRDGFYIVSNEGGPWRTARISDIAAAIDQVVRPIFGDIFSAGSTRRPPTPFRIEPNGAQAVGGRQGKVYRIFGMDDGKPDQSETFVISEDPALKPIGRAMEQFMHAAMVPAAVFVGPAAADIVAETRAIFALGTPLDAGGRFKLEAVETVDVPASAMKLPAKPDTVAQLVAAMKASRTPPK